MGDVRRCRRPTVERCLNCTRKECDVLDGIPLHESEITAQIMVGMMNQRSLDNARKRKKTGEPPKWGRGGATIKTEGERMTNREWLAQNPEQITGDLAEEILFRYHQQNEILFFGDYIENYLSTEHEQRECTVITTYEVTEIILRDLDETDEGLVAEERAEKIKALLDADDVKASKIQIFKRGFDA